MLIRSLGLAAGLFFLGIAAGQASAPAEGEQTILHTNAGSPIAAASGDVGDPVLVARRGADDPPGHDRHDDHGKGEKHHGEKHKAEKHKAEKHHEKERHNGGKDDGPGHD